MLLNSSFRRRRNPRSQLAMQNDRRRIFSLLLFLSLSLPALTAADSPAVYIVHVKKPKKLLSAGPKKLEAWHKTFLPSPFLSSGEPRLVFSYSKSTSGFAARLTSAEAATLALKDGVLAVVLDRRLLKQTTHTPDFLGLRPELWRAANRGEGTIIAVVDSGINPDHVSFSGAKSRRPPWKWRGYCEFTRRRTCNRKLVGARTFFSGEVAQPLPYDVDGHGTHSAAAAAGREVNGAAVNGYANGTAAGAAPAAHLAVYKAATAAEILAAMNQAIMDRVDVICIPMADVDANVPFFLDGIAIGALAAVKEGIQVIAAAGNSGPSPATVRNSAPWILTVGATTTDRVLKASLLLGNGQELAGESQSVFSSQVLSEQLPVVYPKKGCSDLAKLNGKIVVCRSSSDKTAAEKARAVREAGGAAIVMVNSRRRGFTIAEIPDDDIPAIAVDYNTSLRLERYLSSALRPTVGIVNGGTTYFSREAPSVASFSARGPSLVNGEILKPDVLAPGVSILSASHAAKSGYFLSSGTSIAAAHIAGVAAIVNRSSVNWTPAMIRSAIMTTALHIDSNGNPITDQSGSPASMLSSGAGQVNPANAIDPGLVYNLYPIDYVRYLCGLGYTDAEASVTAGRQVECAVVGKIFPEMLNYPSIAVKLGIYSPAVVKRTLTNVLHCTASTYLARVELPSGVVAKVSPRRLIFWRRGQRRSFRVNFSMDNSSLSGMLWERDGGDVVAQGRLVWSSATHTVSTPLLITAA